MTAPHNKHAKSLIAATVLYPRQMPTRMLFETMENAAKELDRLEALVMQSRCLHAVTNLDGHCVECGYEVQG